LSTDTDVTVGYIDPTPGDSAVAIQDLDGTDAASFNNSPVINNTGGGAPQNVVNMAAGIDYTGTDGVVDVFQYEVDSTTGRAVGKDGEVSITGFLVGEDRLEFVDAGDALTDANFETFPGVSLNENPFADNTLISFDPDAGVANVITLAGIQDAALATVDFLVV